MFGKVGSQDNNNTTSEYPLSHDNTLRMIPLAGNPSVRPPKLSGIRVSCSIVHLTGEQFNIEVDKNATGQMVLEMFCAEQRLIDTDFFSMYTMTKINQKTWIDMGKAVSKQQTLLRLGVKYYPPDPTKVGDDFTRYMFCLQLRKDIEEERIPCSVSVRTVMAAYCVQSEMGDHRQDQEQSKFALVDSPSAEYMARIAQVHKNLKELTSAEADLCFLETVKKLPRYSLDYFVGESREGHEMFVGVGCTGLVLYVNNLRVYRFTWLKIVKLSYRGHNFTLKFRKGDAYSAETYRMKDRREAKRLWTRAIECHVFFRLTVALPPRKGVQDKFKSFRNSMKNTYPDYVRNRSNNTFNRVIAPVDTTDSEDAFRRAVLHVTGVSQTVLVEKININNTQLVLT